MNRVLLTIVSTSLLAGCTTQLATSPDRVRTLADATKNRAEATQALEGISYALPMLQYDIAVSGRIETCADPVVIETSDGASKDKKTSPLQKNGEPLYVPTLSFAVSAEPKPKVVPGERYLIDYRRLTNGNKTTSFAIAYHPDGELLKSVNASVDDKTDEVGKAALGVGLAVFGAVFPPAGAAIAGIGAAAAATPAAAPAGNAAKISAGFFESADGFDRARLQNLFALKAMSDAFSKQPAPVVPNPVTTEEKLAALFRKHAKSTKLVVCTKATFDAVAARAQLVDEIDALKTKALSDPRGRFPVTVGKVTISRPIADSGTLADLTARINDLLPLATARALSEVDRARFVAMLAWQRDILSEIELREAKLPKANAKLAQTSSVTWPTDFQGGAAEPLYQPVPDKEDTTNFANVQLELKDVQLVDQAAVAGELRSILDTDELRKKFAAIYNAYIDADNKPRKFKPLTDCSGTTATVQSCVNTNMGLTVELTPAQVVKCAKTAQVACFTTIADQNAINAELKTAYETCVRNGGKKCQEPQPVPTEIHHATGSPPLPGMLVRQPAAATLAICRTAKKDTCGADSIVEKKQVDVPQYGQLRLLPLVNKVFRNNSLTLTVSPLGRIESFSYASNKAVAQVVSAMLKSGTDQYQAFRKERDALEEKKLAEPTVAIKRQADYIQAQIDLKAKKAAQNPAVVSDEARDRQAEIASATSDVNYYTAKKSALIAASCYQLAQSNQPLPEYCF